MALYSPGAGLWFCDVRFAGNGASDPVNPDGAAVVRDSEGVFTLTVPGSGPLRYKGGEAFVDAPHLQAHVVGQTGSRTFQVQILDVRANAGGRRTTVRIDADALAADESTRSVDIATAPGNITGVSYVPDDALVADNTNFATLTLLAEGDVAAAVTTEITGSDDWVAGTPVPLTIDTDEDDVVTGDLLQLDIAKTAAGVAVPAGLLIIEYAPDGVSGTVSSDPSSSDRVYVRLILGPQNI